MFILHTYVSGSMGPMETKYSSNHKPKLFEKTGVSQGLAMELS